MSLKEIASVIDDINEWENPHRPGEFVYYVTAFFTDGDVGSAGRKDLDAAVEVRGLLQEAIGEELDFTLEPKKPTKSGKAAWKILGFGTPGGAATYTAPGVQGASGSTAPGDSGRPGPARGTRSPEPFSEQAFRTPDHFRVERALEYAVGTGVKDINIVLEYADAFNAWMLEKTSEPALREYPQPVVASISAPSTDHQPGAGSETTSPVQEASGTAGLDPVRSAMGPAGDNPSAGELSSLSAPADSEGGVATKGKEPAPPSHEHDWQPHLNLHGWLSCECGENRKKYAP
jgi:hypothetical protein